MNIYDVILKLDLSANEKEIADFIFADPHAFMNSSAEEIISRCYVSRSALYRFCDKTGSNGLSGLKQRLSMDYAEYFHDRSNVNFNYPVKSGESIWKSAHVLQEDYAETIRDTLNLLDYDVLHKCAVWMKNAAQIDIYTSAGNVYFAKNFAFQMQEIGRLVNVPEEEYSQRLTAAAGGSSHFAIVISIGGRGLLAHRIMKILKENHTRCLLICSDEAESLFPYATVRLMVPHEENHARKISSYATRLSILYLLDVLYTAYYSLDYDDNTARKTSYYQKMTEG